MVHTNVKKPVPPATAAQGSAGRNTAQALMPVKIQGRQLQEGYDIYPFHTLEQGQVHHGYASLANWMITQKKVLIDGYAGVYWNEIYAALNEQLAAKGASVKWHFTKEQMVCPVTVSNMVKPFTGEPGGVWGTRCDLQLADFFEKDRGVEDDPAAVLHVVIGTGAALFDEEAPVVFMELPKNELQYRMRAGTITNLGAGEPEHPADMYKRFYFVDWVVLNGYKEQLKQRIHIFADTQWGNTLTWMLRDHLEQAIAKITRTAFRVRPWFDPGAWGGQWLKQHVKQLPQTEVNYAWSFELIVPENGVVFESDGVLLEVPFEWLMYYQHRQVLGRHANIFKYEFPIRFDFLDTFDGGNLSIQCHPTLPYIRQHFGENITQDETYYILDCKEDAGVYLGFTEAAGPQQFRQALEQSRDEGTPVDIEQYVQLHKANKHDLFLIPNGTVHSAGANNMVLEISATPYIFTFKMYDWLRLGLDGQPRAINIEHAFNNLDFSRKGEAVKELLSVPAVIGEGADWQLVHLPTHPEHFYDVQRIEFNTAVSFNTDNYCLVMMLVEGTSVLLEANGIQQEYHYAETFVIPAAAGDYTLVNKGNGRAKVVKAFVRADHPIFSKLSYE